MPIPVNAVLMKQEMDPADIVDFVANFYDTSDATKTPILESGETISSYTLTMSSEGAALGVTIETVAPRAHGLITSSAGYVDNTAIKFWLSVTGANATNAAWDATGTKIPVTVTINTSQNRRRERTMVVTIAQQ